MNWLELGKQVAQFAPLLGRVLPLPGGEIVGELIAHAFGVGNDPKEIAARISADKEAEIKLKQIESDNLVQLQTLSLQRAIDANKDRQDARAKESILLKRGKSSYFTPFLSLLLLTSFVGGMFAIISPYINIGDDDKQLVGAMIMLLGGEVKIMLKYYFGDGGE
jgi:hypothetical protein